MYYVYSYFDVALFSPSLQSGTLMCILHSKICFTFF
jgi:hypothetical protein